MLLFIKVLSLLILTLFIVLQQLNNCFYARNKWRKFFDGHCFNTKMTDILQEIIQVDFTLRVFKSQGKIRVDVFVKPNYQFLDATYLTPVILTKTYVTHLPKEMKLFASHQLLATSHQFLVTSYQLLVTSYQLLVTSYQALVTSHQLLVISHQLLVTRQLLVATFDVSKELVATLKYYFEKQKRFSRNHVKMFAF